MLKARHEQETELRWFSRNNSYCQEGCEARNWASADGFVEVGSCIVLGGWESQLHGEGLDGST